MEMERIYYVVSCKPAYAELMRRLSRSDPGAESGDDDLPQRCVVVITQGGFGQDVVDDELQVKERFLEHLFSSTGIDLTRSADVFDQYFTLEAAGDFVDLDEDTWKSS
ncbi:MAG TPA: hypothetical protein VFV34_27655 [Blastocatellia bacterium]|nr:hypothetical protein [Blastocatellia bacterium]